VLGVVGVLGVFGGVGVAVAVGLANVSPHPVSNNMISVITNTCCNRLLFLIYLVLILLKVIVFNLFCTSV